MSYFNPHTRQFEATCQEDIYGAVEPESAPECDECGNCIEEDFEFEWKDKWYCRECAKPIQDMLDADEKMCEIRQILPSSIVRIFKG